MVEKGPGVHNTKHNNVIFKSRPLFHPQSTAAYTTAGYAYVYALPV
jgi:hypothetical protein